MEQDLFGEVLDDDNLLNELAALDAEEIIPDAATGIVEVKEREEEKQEE